MKILSKIMLLFIIFIGFFNFSYANNSRVDGFNSISTSSKNHKVISGERELGEATRSAGFKILNWLRYIFTGVLVILMVYSGIQMILSQGTDDDSLSKAKRSIWYAVIGMVFINFPMEIYRGLVSDKEGGLITIVNIPYFRNLTINILTAVEILITGLAIFILVYEGIKLIVNSRKEEEAINNAKQKIIRVLVALISIGFIEVWIKFLETGDLNKTTSIFQSLANLALYIAGPIAIFFLTLAGYYYIFSNGDEEKMKKGKNIIINTSIGVIILLCIYVLLNDISLLNF